jgi:pilus assembly protein CpaC
MTTAPIPMLINILWSSFASLCLLSTCALAQPVSGERVPQNINLLIGAQKTIALTKPLERVAVGNPDIADALLLKSRNTANNVLLVGKKAGSTSVIVWERGGASTHYRVQVDAAEPVAGGPRVTVSGDTAVVTGQARDVYDLARARSSAQAATGTRKAGVVVDQSTLPVSNTVQVDVKVVEFSKTVLKEAGFSLFLNRSGFSFGSFAPGSLRGYDMSGAPGAKPGLSVDMTSPITSAFNLVGAISGGIFSNMSLLEANGMARVLAEPTLVALSGQSATFLAGGEIPIPVPQAFGTTTIEYKQFGIGLTVSPTVLGPNRIALKVAPEASDLDPTRGIVLNGASVPAIITRRADTTVELGDGESFVIGGLVSRNTLSNVDKVPLLGDIPILGTFFKRLNFHQEDRELMIVVTPHLVKPIARQAPVANALPGDGMNPNPWTWRNFVLGAVVEDGTSGFSK